MQNVHPYESGKLHCVPWDALIKSTSISASLSRVQNDMLASLKSAENMADSGRRGRDAPFGRPPGTRWLRHSSLCGTCRIASSFLASASLSASESFADLIRASLIAISSVTPDATPDHAAGNHPAHIFRIMGLRPIAPPQCVLVGRTHPVRRPPRSLLFARESMAHAEGHAAGRSSACRRPPA